MMDEVSQKHSETPSRCGFVSIIGRPNVGKSTLLNTIIGEKIAIVSKVPQTTSNQIKGIYTDERGQIIFVDTPGVYLGKDKLDQLLIKTSFATLEDADCVIHLVDSSEQTGEEEEEIVRRLSTARVPVILGLNKIDLKGHFLPRYIALWKKMRGCPVTEMKSFLLLPLSGKTKMNVDKLLDAIFEFLPEGPALYSPDTVTDLPQKIAIGDIIREKLLTIMRDEVPHSIAVHVEAIQPKKKDVLFISAIIFVERDSQKEIVIGKDGQIIKKIGTLARKELEPLLGSRIFLELHVKSQKKWRDNLSFLQELGYDD